MLLCCENSWSASLQPKNHWNIEFSAWTSNWSVERCTVSLRLCVMSVVYVSFDGPVTACLKQIRCKICRLTLICAVELALTSVAWAVGCVSVTIALTDRHLRNTYMYLDHIGPHCIESQWLDGFLRVISAYCCNRITWCRRSVNVKSLIYVAGGVCQTCSSTSIKLLCTRCPADAEYQWPVAS